MSKRIESKIYIERDNLGLHIYEVKVTGFYSPAEPAETGPEAQYPGCEESACFGAATYGGEPFELSEADISKAEAALMEAAHARMEKI